MRADFEKHLATVLLYPSRKDVWRADARYIQETVTSLCNEIARFERTYLGADRAVTQRLDKAVVQCQMDYDDIWIRDTGPIPTAEGYVKFGFNAWGGAEGLSDSWGRDATVADSVVSLLNGKVRSCDLTLEGGNLASNGKGTVIAVKAAIANPNRNPHKSLDEIERGLSAALGISKLIWLDEGLRYDETGGHVDNIAAFVDESTAFLAWTDEADDVQYEVVHKAYETLIRHGIDVVKIPLPKIFYRNEADTQGLVIRDGCKPRLQGEPIQASYINFIFTNGGVIVPQFGDECDGRVVEIFRNYFTNRKIIPFPAREIVLGGGGLHCITKNV